MKKIVHLKIFVLGENNLTYLLKLFVHCCKFLSYQIKMADSNHANLEECGGLASSACAGSGGAVGCGSGLLTFSNVSLFEKKDSRER